MKKKERERRKARMQIKDPQLAAMDELAYSEYRVRVGLMTIKEFKIWAHDENDAVNKVKAGAGTMASQSEPEVVSVQVGRKDTAVTDVQAKETARVVENALAQKNPNVQLPGDIAGGKK